LACSTLCAQSYPQTDDCAGNSGKRANYSRDSALPLSPLGKLKAKYAHPNKRHNQRRGN